MHANNAPTASTSLERWLTAIGCIVLFCLSFFAINSDTFSDPKLNFVVSQSLIDHGTVALDAYENAEILGRPFDYYRRTGDIIDTGEHYYHYFPTGPSVLMVPVVWVANQLGRDMLTADNLKLQNLLSALSVATLFLIWLRIGRRFIPQFQLNFLIIFIAIAGSSLISTLGSAFWTLNLTALVYSWILLIIISRDWTLIQPNTNKEKNRLSQKRRLSLSKPERTIPNATLADLVSVREFDRISVPLLPLLLGTLIFLAFFIRASAVAFILPLFALMLWTNWRASLRPMAVAGILLGLFLLWSQVTFGRWLPAYYGVERLTVERIPFHIGLIGNLVSPSRGFFIFSPIFAVVGIVLAAKWRSFLKNPLVLFGLGWFSLSVVLVARAATWYGGWSFGARILADVTPAWVLLTLVVAQSLGRAQSRNVFYGAFLLTGVFAVAIHSGQALYNQNTSLWNAYSSPKPSIHSAHPWGDMFSWDEAQWAADSDMLCGMETRIIDHFLDVPLPIGTLPNGQYVGFNDDAVITYRDVILGNDLLPQIVLEGWGSAEANFRWSTCRETNIYFDMGPLVPDSELYTFSLRIYGVKPQPVEILLNGNQLVDAPWDDTTPSNGEVFVTAHFSHFNELGRNQLTFHFPDAAPHFTHQRQLAIAFAGIKLEALPTNK